MAIPGSPAAPAREGKSVPSPKTGRRKSKIGNGLGCACPQFIYTAGFIFGN